MQEIEAKLWARLIETAKQPEPMEKQKIDAELREQFRDGTLDYEREDV